VVCWAAGRYLMAYDVSREAWVLERGEAHSEAIRDMCFWGDRCCTVADDKTVVLWDTSSWKVLRSWQLQKKPLCCCFTSPTQVHLGDRFGDVMELDVGSDEAPRVAFSHLAIVTRAAVDGQRRFLITGDKDEKVRISRADNTRVIHSFCLGHTSFVSAVVPIPSSDLLVSTAANGCVRLWRMSGECLAEVRIQGCVSAAAGGAGGLVVCLLEGSTALKVVRVTEDPPGLAVEADLDLGYCPQAVGMGVLNGRSVLLAVNRSGHLCLPVDLETREQVQVGSHTSLMSGEDVPADTVNLHKHNADHDGDGERPVMKRARHVQ